MRMNSFMASEPSEGLVRFATPYLKLLIQIMHVSKVENPAGTNKTVCLLCVGLEHLFMVSSLDGRVLLK